MKPVIYFVHYSAKPGGIEVLLPLIINELKQWEIKVFVIRPPKQNDLNVYKDLPVEIEYGSGSTLVALIKFFSLGMKNKKDIYHLFNTGPFFLFVLRVAGIKKAIYSIHGTLYWKTVFQKFIRKTFWFLANTNKIIFISNSEYSANVFNEKVLKRAIIKKIYNPMDLKRFNYSGRSQNVKDELEIIFVGRLAEGKNLFLWIETAEFLIENGIKAVFNIYGNGELYGDIEKRLRNSKYKENIKLKGHISNIDEVYKNADLLLFLSEYESFGNVVVESILCGVPVIAVNIPSMKEIFNDFPVFLIDKNKNTGEQVLHKLHQFDMLRSAADKAANNFSTKFGTKQHIDQLVNIYSNLK